MYSMTVPSKLCKPFIDELGEVYVTSNTHNVLLSVYCEFWRRKIVLVNMTNYSRQSCMANSVKLWYTCTSFGIYCLSRNRLLLVEM